MTQIERPHQCFKFIQSIQSIPYHILYPLKGCDTDSDARGGSLLRYNARPTTRTMVDDAFLKSRYDVEYTMHHETPIEVPSDLFLDFVPFVLLL